METVAVPKMMVYVFDLLILGYILKGIFWVIGYFKHQKELAIYDAEFRRAAYRVDGTNKFFAELFNDISRWDKVKLYMYYESLLNKEQRHRKKFLQNEERKMREGE